MALELYETTYGICDHLSVPNPLSLVQYNPCEEYLQDYFYDRYLATFIERDLGRKLHMSFDDFLNRPRHEIEAILRVTGEVVRRQNTANENLLQGLESAKRNPKSKTEP